MWKERERDEEGWGGRRIHRATDNGVREADRPGGHVGKEVIPDRRKKDESESLRPATLN